MVTFYCDLDHSICSLAGNETLDSRSFRTLLRRIPTLPESHRGVIRLTLGPYLRFESAARIRGEQISRHHVSPGTRATTDTARRAASALSFQESAVAK